MIDLERLWTAVQITGMIVVLVFVFVLGIWISKNGITDDTPWWRDILLMSAVIGCLIFVIYAWLGV